HPQDSAGLRGWVAKMAASGVRVTVITSSGQVLADSQSDPKTKENHADRPEIRDALATGHGQSIRHIVTINSDLLYQAVRLSSAGASPVVLRFALPLQMVDQEIWEFRRRLWLASLVVLLVTGAASLLISWSFSDRVDRLTDFFHCVAGGDFRPLDADRAGESLVAFAVSFYWMAERLERIYLWLASD